MTPIQYEVRVPSSDWTPFFSSYEPQKYGRWDSDSCWALSAINCAEDQFEWLWKNGMFSQEAKDFFTNSGYLDSNGDPDFSERYIEIKSGARDNGNDQMQAWVLMQEYGCIPRSQLSYDLTQSNQFGTQTAFDADYFNPSSVTPDMDALGQKFLSYVNISRQWIGGSYQTPDLQILQAALKQAPLQIGIPVNASAWNSSYVPYGGGTDPNHAVELYGIDDQGNYMIYDQYEPNPKKLAANYFLAFVSQGILNAIPAGAPNPIPQDTMFDMIWTAINNVFNGIFGT